MKSSTPPKNKIHIETNSLGIVVLGPLVFGENCFLRPMRGKSIEVTPTKSSKKQRQADIASTAADNDANDPVRFSDIPGAIIQREAGEESLWFFDLSGLNKASWKDIAWVSLELRSDESGDEPLLVFDHPLASRNLFNADFYRSQIEADPFDTVQAARLHYAQRSPRERKSPHGLFDPDWYLKRCLHKGIEPEGDLFSHYLAEGEKLRLAPNPLFDISHIVDQLQGEFPEQGAMQRYLAQEFSAEMEKPLQPHPFFDVVYYAIANPDVIDAGYEPLTHFLRYGAYEGRRGHPLFVDPGRRHGSNLHAPLDVPQFAYMDDPGQQFVLRVFDERFYLAGNPDIPASGMSALYHFLRFGWKEGRDPHPYFNVSYYLRQMPVDSTRHFSDPLTHFISEGWKYHLNPHPLIDSLSCADNPRWDTESYSLLSDYDSQQAPSPLVNKGAPSLPPVTAAHVDLPSLREWLKAHGSPLLSALMHELGRQPGIPFQANHRKTTALVLVHEATRTGAPLIILEIARRLKETHKIDCLFVLEYGGEIAEEFQQIGPVFNKDHLRSAHGITNMAPILAHAIDPQRTFCLGNSAETISQMEIISWLGIPTIGLIHEFAHAYDSAHFTRVFRACESVIFPSSPVETSALEAAATNRFPIAPDCHSVIPQGIFSTRFLTPRNERNRARIRKQLGIDQEAFVVLGCGTVDQRKGVDLFVATAALLQQRSPDSSIHFIWVGADNFSHLNNREGFWIKQDIKLAGLGRRVQFLGAHADTKPFLDASDALFLPTRMDPFPCVVLEGMAAGLPCILFENATGSTDIVNARNGAVVPYLDLVAAAKTLLQWEADPALPEGLGAAGRELVARDFSFDNYVERILACVAEKLPQKRLGSWCQSTDTEVDALKLPEDARRRLFIITPNWSLSGVNSFTESLARQLRDLHDWDVAFVFTRPRWEVTHPNNLELRDQLPDFPYHFVAEKSDTIDDARAGLLDFLTENTPCAALFGFDFDCLDIVRHLPRSVISAFMVQADEPCYYDQAYKLGPHIDRIIAVSQRIGEQIIASNPLLDKRIRVIPNSTVKLETCTAATSRAPATGRPIRMVYSGRIVDTQKRVSDFRHILEHLDMLGVDYEFTIIGSDGFNGNGLEAKLRSYWDAKIHAGEVRFAGRLSHSAVFKVLERTDFFLLVSEYEGMPLSLIEAMACGCIPVVSPIASGVPDLIPDDTVGVVMPDRDWKSFAQRIAEITQDPQRKKNLHRAASRWIADHFTLEATASAYDAAFDPGQAEKS